MLLAICRLAQVTEQTREGPAGPGLSVQIPGLLTLAFPFSVGSWLPQPLSDCMQTQEPSHGHDFPAAHSLPCSAGVQHQERSVLIFDLGGGTFDVSLLTIDEGIFEVGLLVPGRPCRTLPWQQRSPGSTVASWLHGWGRPPHWPCPARERQRLTSLARDTAQSWAALPAPRVPPPAL